MTKGLVDVADDLSVTGVDQFLRLSKALKNAGRTQLRSEFHAALRKAAKPATKKTQEALAEAVPAGLKGRAGKTKQAVQVRTGRDPGVRIVVRYGKRGTGLSASNARLLNRGLGVRHPLYGNREHWYNTPVPGARGWFDDTLAHEAPDVRRELEAARQRIMDKIAGETRG